MCWHLVCFFSLSCLPQSLNVIEIFCCKCKFVLSYFDSYIRVGSRRSLEEMEKRCDTVWHDCTSSFLSSLTIFDNVLFKYDRIEEFVPKRFVNFMCVHNYRYCYGNEVEGDYDDNNNNGNNDSIIRYSTLYFIHYDSAPIYVESVQQQQQHNICVLHITAKSAFRSTASVHRVCMYECKSQVRSMRHLT